MKTHNYLIFVLIAVLPLLSGCSAEKTNILATTYHNITAHYNAYWYAKQQMVEMKSYIWENHENNFNKILKILPPLDSTIAQALNEQSEECIKKASIAIQRHPNSRWVDDSYILVGQARLIRQEFADAIETFKYVNTNSEDKHARHKALIELMRTFIEYKELNNAEAVSDFLQKERLTRDNLKNLHIMRAYLAQIREDYNSMVQHLVLAAPLVSRKEGKSRIYFIIGQIYQQLGFDAQAYNNYGLCLKNNPDFDLAFYAKLNRAQVVELSDGSDVKKVNKYFTRLLKDRKNKEFKDKIYYEMGRFEYKQGHIDKAIENYKLSVRNSTTNRRQKAYAYLNLGKIYYEDLAKYELSKAYYDSVLIELPQDEENYAAIQERQQVLENFVKQIKTIELQDSLLALSRLDSGALNQMFDELIEKENEEKLKEEEKARTEARAASFIDPDDLGFEIKNEGTWYFYNQAALEQGYSEFRKKWGRRPLEDNWRRAAKENTVEVETPLIKQEEGDTVRASIEQEENISNPYAQKKADWFGAIPFSSEQKAQAHAMIEEALYKLGNIYHFDLKEDYNAVLTYEKHLARYSDSERVPEVLYLLYLINQELDSTKSVYYKNRLLDEYPESEYAKTLLNPNYKEESRRASKELKRRYESAYNFYEQQEYDTAMYILSRAEEEFYEDPFIDHIKLLKILIIGKTEGLFNYQYQLDEFIKTYSESELIPYAQKLRSTSDDVQKEIERRRGIVYSLDFDVEHDFVAVYEKNNTELSNSLSRMLQQLADTTGHKNTTATSLNFEADEGLVLIRGFESKENSLSFLRIYLEALEKNKAMQELIQDQFVISEKNFETFYKYKDKRGYQKFFKNHYYY